MFVPVGHGLSSLREVRILGDGSAWSLHNCKNKANFSAACGVLGCPMTKVMWSPERIVTHKHVNSLLLDKASLQSGFTVYKMHLKRNDAHHHLLCLLNVGSCCGGLFFCNMVPCCGPLVFFCNESLCCGRLVFCNESFCCSRLVFFCN